MRHTEKFLSAGVAAILLLWHPQVIAGQNTRQAAEVELRAPTFQDVLNQLFGTPGMPGLLNGNQAFEFKAENLMLSPQQARDFFAPASPNGMDFAALAAAVERLPGAEVKIEGRVNGAPFELKLEAGEVKLEGLALTQAQLNSLFNQLQMIPGIREVKIEGRVNGRPVEVEAENKERKVERVKANDRAEAEHDRRELHGRHREVEHRERMEAEHREDREEHLHMERSARMDRTERVQRTERIERPERHERMERVERVEKIERPQRIERIERAGRH